ncbi:ABC transporter ATP-binding protein [Entomospira culicis]|uniref:ABC transporter ATP-binding protein n=1 Tax=Entomospira culicis TaxID=2719989 RepID=A0A968KUX8_9SPIO|nr:ABC transporter ATP-binding protein [Entomospira culicis]NIZ19810.1 ABC transporter ATP-binding protein [Entomospira culicis]NIZ70024.1 ABC transporter ATP-binding protein [Entomospira culicis]WDI37130.1 ABC transporter ATP-binding protein [Entomospira culicis]WDI38759.1 ABC transporter ATP-binding protein [Entomospira culicis]
MSPKPILYVEQLEKSYKVGDARQKVLHHLTFSLYPKEVMAVVGESGSGKSTLLNLIAGLDPFDGGTITSCGVDVGKASDRTLAQYRNEELGFIFQFHFLLEDFTVLENVCMPAWLAGRRGATVDARARYLLDAVGMANKEKSLPARLSGGERQRVAVARALMNRPKLILADEPTGSLDGYHAQNVFRLMVDLTLAEEGSLLLVTHDLQLAKRASRQLELTKVLAGS